MAVVLEVVFPGLSPEQYDQLKEQPVPTFHEPHEVLIVKTVQIP